MKSQPLEALPSFFTPGRSYRIHTLTHDIVEGRVTKIADGEILLGQARLLLSIRMTARDFPVLIMARANIAMAWPLETTHEKNPPQT